MAELEGIEAVEISTVSNGYTKKFRWEKCDIGVERLELADCRGSHVMETESSNSSKADVKIRMRCSQSDCILGSIKGGVVLSADIFI